jgi:iron complex outermembrane receptor protein
MNKGIRRSGSKLLLLSLVALSFFAPTVSAQGNAATDEEEEEAVTEIIVTGTRIRRDEYTSPSPLQRLDVDAGRQIGVTSIAELLFRSPVTNGAQIDQTLNTNALTFNATEESPPGGVGSTNVSLRGLGPERTLVLMNGRRLGSVGVRGAPAQPDISLIPFALVERVDVLTEGVSAIYGADAVAGVVNVILREDFEGFEVMGSTSFPGDTGGEVGQLSFLAGLKNDSGSFQFAAEIYDRERVVTGDREWAHCLQDIVQIDDGRIESICSSPFPDNLGATPSGAFFFTEGQSDIGVPNWSSFNALPPPDHPLVQDTSLRYVDLYNDQDERRASDLVGEIERFSLVTTGKLSVDWWANEEVYFEAFYLNSQVFSKATTEQIFPFVPGQIAQEDANGNIIVDATGAPILVDNPLSPMPSEIFFVPVTTLDSVPQHRDVERQQSRFLLGMRGDLGNSTWNWDAFVSYDRGVGFQAQPILFEPHFLLSVHNTRIDANGDVTCDFKPINSAPGFNIITPEPCVPLDFTNSDLYIGGPTGEGTFTDAEAAYLVGNRTNRTVVEQTMINAYATGELFDIGGDRTVAAAFGMEYRLDEIDSQNDIVGVQGLNSAENPLQEGSTFGDRDIFEAFAEANFPLLDSLDFDAALRYTDEENFGSEVTWRARLAWRPLDYLTLSGSVGTSYRAPNLREQFLAGQGGGVAGSIDPCRARSIAERVLINGDMDPRTVNLANNCALAGVQMIDADSNGFLDTSLMGVSVTIPTSAGGNAELIAETSESYTATIQLIQPWTDRFGLDFAISYWDIVIENTVEESDAGLVVSNCYSDIDFPNLSSPFCSLQSRLTDPSGFSGQINFIDVSFINIGEQTASGIDFNTRFSYSFDGPGIDLLWSTASTWYLEQEIQTFSIEDRDDNLGEIGSPEWRFTSTLSTSFRDWEFLMQNRYIGDGEQDTVQEFAERNFAPLMTRRVAWVGSVWYTDISLTYGKQAYSVTAGISNLLDQSPPLIAYFQGPNRNSAVTSSGYDFFGRTFFMTGKIGF